MDVLHELCTRNYTKVVCEDEWNYNAPHHFLVKSIEDDKTVSRVDFQEGPIKECGINGVNNEDLILMVITRLNAFQNSDYKCDENAEAVKHLEDALRVLRERTNKRAARGVEGTSTV